MRTRLKHVSQWGFAVVVAAGLSFGARSALAAPLIAAVPTVCENGPCNSAGLCPGACIVDGFVLDGICDRTTWCCDCPR